MKSRSRALAPYEGIVSRSGGLDPIESTANVWYLPGKHNTNELKKSCCEQRAKISEAMEEALEESSTSIEMTHREVNDGRGECVPPLDRSPIEALPFAPQQRFLDAPSSFETLDQAIE